MLVHDRHNGFLGLVRLVFVPLDRDGVLLGFASLGQVDLHTEVVADLHNHRTALADHQRMVLGVHFEF